jgi:hypothetical protein
LNVNFGIINQKGSPAFYQDLYADIPNPGFLGRIFIGTDNFNIYRDTGTTWDLISGGAGSVNPGNFYMPYVNSGAFANSYLYNKSDENYLSSIFLTKKVGLHLNFSGAIYTFGEFDFVNTGTKLIINAASSLIEVKNQNVTNGISLDFFNDIFIFGDCKNYSHGANINFDQGQGLTYTKYENQQIGLKFKFKTFEYFFGDFNHTKKGTYVDINDGTGYIKTHFDIYNVGLSVDFSTNKFILGDYEATGGKTRVLVDDSSTQVFLYANNPIQLNDNSTGNMISTTAGGNSGKHLKLTINGVSYKIELKNP